jgi:signal transduction histidine kinase
LEEFTNSFTAKGVTLEKRLPERLSLMGDRDLLQIVVKNLIDNALKYGRPGGTIRLLYEPLVDRARFEVCNQGEAMTPEQLGQMFDKFVRIRRSAGKTQGTGLGLFITKDIVQKHGGEIWAESEADHWVKVIFTLPKANPSD